MLLGASAKACTSFQRRCKRLMCFGWIRRLTVVAFILFTSSITTFAEDGTIDLDKIEDDEVLNPVNNFSRSLDVSSEYALTNDTELAPTNDTVDTESNDIINATTDHSSVGYDEDQKSTNQNDTVNTSNHVAETGSHADPTAPDLPNTKIGDYSHDNVGFTPPVMLSESSENKDDFPSPQPSIVEVIEPTFTSVNASLLGDSPAVDIEPTKRQEILSESSQSIDSDAFFDGIANDTLDGSSPLLEQAVDQPDKSSINRTDPNATFDATGTLGALDKADAQVLSEPERHPSEISTSSDIELDATKSEIIEDLVPDGDHLRSYHHCGIWGDDSFVRRRREPNMSILQQLFHGEISLRDDIKSGRSGLVESLLDADVTNTPSSDEKPTESNPDDKATGAPSMRRTTSNSLKNSDSPTESTTTFVSSNDLVSGLDDIDNLFEGVDPPDELDVGADGASIQEVLMGSATRLVIKRITVSGRFLLRKANQARVFIAHQLGNATKDSKLFDNFRDENGKIFSLDWLHDAKNAFAPLQWLRGDDGEFIPIQLMESTGWGSALLEKIRQDDGESLKKAKKYFTKIASSVRNNVVTTYFKVESFFDKLFEGPDLDDEDLNFKFYSDFRGDDLVREDFLVGDESGESI